MQALRTSDRAVLESLSRPSTLPVVSSAAVRVAYLMMLWSERRRTRVQLQHMPEHLLRDIGLTSTQARQECRKWFWRP